MRVSEIFTLASDCGCDGDSSVGFSNINTSNGIPGDENCVQFSFCYYNNRRRRLGNIGPSNVS